MKTLQDKNKQNKRNSEKNKQLQGYALILSKLSPDLMGLQWRVDRLDRIITSLMQKVLLQKWQQWRETYYTQRMTDGVKTVNTSAAACFICLFNQTELSRTGFRVDLFLCLAKNLSPHLIYAYSWYRCLQHLCVL